MFCTEHAKYAGQSLDIRMSLNARSFLYWLVLYTSLDVSLIASRWVLMRGIDVIRVWCSSDKRPATVGVLSFRHRLLLKLPNEFLRYSAVEHFLLKSGMFKGGKWRCWQWECEKHIPDVRDRTLKGINVEASILLLLSSYLAVPRTSTLFCTNSFLMLFSLKCPSCSTVDCLPGRPCAKNSWIRSCISPAQESAKSSRRIQTK